MSGRGGGGGDKGLLAGFILEFADRLVDMSVKKKLEESTTWWV